MAPGPFLRPIAGRPWGDAPAARKAGWIPATAATSTETSGQATTVWSGMEGGRPWARA